MTAPSDRLFSNLNITQKGLLLVLTPVLFEVLCVGFLALFLFPNIEADLAAIEHQSQALFLLSKIGSITGRASTYVLGYRNPETDGLRAQSELKKLDEFDQPGSPLLSADFPELRDAMDQARAIRNNINKLIESTELKRQSDLIHNRIETTRSSDFRAVMFSLVDFSDSTKRIINMESIINAQQPREMNAVRTRVFSALFLLTLLPIVVTLVLLRFFTTDILRRLEAISNNAQALALGRNMAPPGSGHDELADLDNVIHEAGNVLSDIRRQELAVLENAADVICSLDANLRFTAVNNASLRQWNYQPDELRGMSLLRLLPESECDSVRAQFQRIADDKKESEIECTFKCKPSTWKTIQWSVRWNEDERSYICVARDVTELRAVERLKQHIILVAGHDLRSPLTAIKMSVDMALSGDHGSVEPEVRRELERMERSMDRLMELIKDLLELGKLESGTVSIDSKCVHAYNVCAMACESLAGMASMAQIKILKPQGDGLMLAEEGRLVQCVVNLLSNAIKFSPKGSTVSLAIERGDDLVEISVSDQGPGLSPEDQAIIFEKFSQAKVESEVSTRSSGLGLAIVRAIARAHGGEAGVSSEVGKGSRFWLRIPKYNGPEAKEDEDL